MAEQINERTLMLTNSVTITSKPTSKFCKLFCITEGVGCMTHCQVIKNQRNNENGQKSTDKTSKSRTKIEKKIKIKHLRSENLNAQYIKMIKKREFHTKQIPRLYHDREPHLLELYLTVSFSIRAHHTLHVGQAGSIIDLRACK